MTRPIKFRAWNKQLKKMTRIALDAEYLSIEPYDGASEVPEVIEPVAAFEWPEIYEIMQFTGLFDKNKVEIYEGDIVRLEGRNQDGNPIEGSEVVTFEAAGFRPFVGVVDYDSNTLADYLMTDGKFLEQSAKVEVIGNIHENPELVK